MDFFEGSVTAKHASFGEEGFREILTVFLNDRSEDVHLEFNELS